MRPRDSHRGSVLIIVLWVALGLVSLALYFADSMALELRAADNRTATVAADQAIEGGARYVAYVLTTYATNGVMPDVSEYQAAAVPVGDEHFWLIGRDNSANPAHPDQVTFALVDEASKLNLNTASTNVIGQLPRMTTDLLTAILDWRGTNGNGGTQIYYALQNPSYQCKHAPFETVDELRLAYGSSLDILVGDDLNRNGILDPNEPSDSGDTQVNPGLFEYLTVYSREPNSHSDGTMRTNVNNQVQLRAALQAHFGAGRTTQIMNQLGFRRPAGGPPAPPPTFRSLLEFYVKSGMNATDFTQIYHDVTVSSAPYTRGRVNINTASATALACLPGMDTGTAQQVLTYREANTNNLTSIAWIVDALGAGSAAIQALATGDYLTTQSYQFTADIAAVGAHGRGYRRVKFVFDLSEGTAKIVYRQDLSRLGWALGDDVRQKLLAQTTS